jgi:ribonucleoside-diphosphate reductase alpha chain
MEAEIETFKIFQKFHNATIRASSLIAKEKGVYPKYSESKWAEGVLPYDLGNETLRKEFEQYLDREELEETRNLVKLNGVRNALIMNLPPTASSASSKNLTESIEPIMFHSYNLQGAVSCQVLAPELAKLRKYYMMLVQN